MKAEKLVEMIDQHRDESDKGPPGEQKFKKNSAPRRFELLPPRRVDIKNDIQVNRVRPLRQDAPN